MTGQPDDVHQRNVRLSKRTHGYIQEGAVCQFLLRTMQKWGSQKSAGALDRHLLRVGSKNSGMPSQ